MDATTRWETEAMRGGGENRQSPPKPSRKQVGDDFVDNRHWVTLKEAEEATGIPTNTLRKWVRRADLPSYLEADGDLALRMVDLDAVVARANDLGREISPTVPPPVGADVPPERAPEAAPEPSTPETPPETMIVPIDAWNKMLNQLGNLHEAGQQLAEASERAAKAETESTFLREQLAESRLRNQESRIEPHEPEIEPEPDTTETDLEPEPEETTSYWRYLTTGWRDRKKRD
jgi:hypothetical protein